MKRNLKKAIEKVKANKGLLSESIVTRTAKQALNWYDSPHRDIFLDIDEELKTLLNDTGIRAQLEAPLKGRKLDKALTEKGITFLKNFLFKKNGEKRNSKDVKTLDYHVFEVVKKFSHFTFEGFQDEGHGNFGNYLPVWRVHAKNGAAFSYIYFGWPYSGNNLLACFHFDFAKKK